MRQRTWRYADWRAEDQMLARREGWDMYTNTWGALNIEEWPASTFEAEKEWLNHVEWMAMAGSPLHVKAWILHKRTRREKPHPDIVEHARTIIKAAHR